MKVSKEEDEEKSGGTNEEEEENEGKTVVVGVRLDAESRELLTWALVKVAIPGDHVVALHVLHSSSSSSSTTTTTASFDSMLAVYEGFCHLKQIDLKLKICRGSSIRKALVREANAFAAATLILGVNKNARPIGSSATSIAKYCAKKLPLDCSVRAVNNGKIVFQREASESKRSRNHGQLRSLQPSRSFSKLDDSNSLSGTKGQEEICLDTSALGSSVHCLDLQSEHGSSLESIDVDNISVSTDASPTKNCPICEPASVPQHSSNLSDELLNIQSKERESSGLVHGQKLEASMSSNAVPVKELPKVKPGWPVLRRALVNDRKNDSEIPRVSMIQRATWLPSWFAASSSVHPDRKPTKSNSNVQSSSDVKRNAIVREGTNLVHPANEEAELPKELECLQEKCSSVCRVFSYKELVDATSNFSSEKLIGKGGNSKVYKGCLSDGKELAVKILKPTEDVIKEFVSEVEIITTLHHRNIISLLGFCFENNNLILVYDLLLRGSLEENLHGEEDKRSVLTWVERYNVALGVADALDYLHGGGSGQSVIHRDVKSSNILLSDDFQPKLSDFGLVAKASSSASHITCSDVAGTFGYLAPEYFMYGKVNEKVDVYAYGVVLLELLSGRKPIITGCPKGQESLVMWAKPILQGGKGKELVDPSLGNKYDGDQMERMALAASLCIRHTPRSRPRIDVVSKLLQGDDEVVRWAKSHVSSSEELEGLDDEAAFLNSNIQSHLSLALLDVEDDSSISSSDHTVDFITTDSSFEDYLQGRWSRTSSFD